jgi:hypothetical protein
MATHGCTRIHIPPQWDDQYKKLEYITEPFNDRVSINRWLEQGYTDKFVGDMCDMRSQQPSWNNYFIGYFSQLGWKNIGTSYYRMDTGTILPEHSDLYKKYVDIFQLQGQEHKIHRAVIFLEDWQSGHYLECAGEPITGWCAGDGVVWQYDTPHLAANMGTTPRYSLQITGHL